MKNKIDADKLLHCIGLVGDDLIIESETVIPQKSRINFKDFSVKQITAFAAVLVLGLVVVGLYFVLPINIFNERDGLANEQMFLTTESQSLPRNASHDAPTATPPNVADNEFRWAGDSARAGGAAAETVPDAPQAVMPDSPIPDRQTHFSVEQRDGWITEWAEELPIYRLIYEENRELVGFYPTLTLYEATKIVLSDGEKTITHVEIVYLLDNENLMSPFFRFYIEMPPDLAWEASHEIEQLFDIIYVSAIRQE